MKRPLPSRSTRATLLAAFLVVAGTAAPQAAPGTAPDATCTAPSGAAPVIVASVTDELDVTLADGRSLRLAGLDAPQATTASPDLPARARRTLEAWAASGTVTIYLLAAAPDRWGRIPALLSHGSSDPLAPTSATEAILRAGLGRVRPEPAVHACLAALLGAEAAARGETLGLWADPHYAILRSGDTAGLAGQAGGLALVQGVLHLHESHGTLYLGLGRDRRGFVAIVQRHDAQRFARAGFDLHDYDGTPVRLRGDLDDRFGPRLRLTDPDAVESLEPGSLADEGASHP